MSRHQRGVNLKNTWGGKETERRFPVLCLREQPSKRVGWCTVVAQGLPRLLISHCITITVYDHQQKKNQNHKQKKKQIL